MRAYSRDEVIAISNRAADAAGIPILLLLACGIAEGNLRWNARRPADPADDERYWPDVSGSPWQQAVRYDPDYRGGAAYPGEAEIERVLALQYDVERSARVAAANLSGKFHDGTETDDDENLARDLYEYNWPAGGERPYSPAHEDNYRRGLREARSILGAPAMSTRVTYNRDEPAIAQNDDWSCSVTSTRWALRALGRSPTEAWIEGQMRADGVVSTSDGLLDANGGPLAFWITRQYGEFGYYANNEPRGDVTFDALAAEFAAPANPYPGLIGGSAWGHWSGLRSYDSGRDVLLLANPAEGWKGVGQTMNRDQFAALGPFSLVRVLHPDLLAPRLPTVPAIDWRTELDQILSRHAADAGLVAEIHDLLARVPA